MPPPTTPEPAVLTLPALPDSVRTARRFVLERVAGFPADLCADAVLVTSELCTNCVVHARSDYQVRVYVRDDAVRIEVLDDDPDVPAPGPKGRGLQVVEELAVAWGVDTSVAGPGKAVWVELRRDR